MRECGVLLPISSLPSKYGIGCFSKSAYEFVDSMASGGQSYWQILPLGPTGYGDSPYQSFSTYAGNPYYIDLEQLIWDGLLSEKDCMRWNFHEDERMVDYGKVYLSRKELLFQAFTTAKPECKPEFLSFCNAQAFWLEDYALFMAVKDLFSGAPWQEWDIDIKLRKPEALEEYRQKLKIEVNYYKYIQYLFYDQWKRLKGYANERGIKIIGDIPIYVALDSADTWSQSDHFLFDENKMPSQVAGCPPDAFAKEGQLWGNPVYNWQVHKESKYRWWVSRIRHCTQLYDVTRIDHFRGFDEYYSIPAQEKTARQGSWRQGPGYDLFQTLKTELGSIRIIAEDLGYMNESVKELLRKTGYPGMKILQFAFDSRETSNYLPHNYERNCVVYTGTHDNDTLLGWYRSLNEKDKCLAREYSGIRAEEDCCRRLLSLAYGSVADLVVIPIQDFLKLGSEGRINRPSTVGGNNWRWRLKAGELTAEIIKEMKFLAKLYER